MPINNKIKPVVIKALKRADHPEAEKSLAWTTITLLGKRINQLDAEIQHAETERQRVRKIRDSLLDNFPEPDDL